MSWKDDEFIKGSEGQGYGGPSMDEIATRIQNKIIRWGAVIYDKFYGSQEQFRGRKCLICGEIVESVILENRQLMRAGQGICLRRAKR